MKEQLFPKEIIEQTTEHHFWKHSVRSQILYSSLLLSLIATLAALPFLYVDVSVSAQGIIRPESERKVLVSPVSGRVTYLGIRENDTVPKRMLVAKVESPLLEEQLSYNRHRQKEVKRYSRDLNHLIKLDSTEIFEPQQGLKSSVFKRSLIAFQQELQNSRIELQNAQRLYERQQYLYNMEAIPSTDLEESKYVLNSAKSHYQLLFDQQLSKWETELARYQQKLDELRTQELQLKEEQRQYEIHMPVTGTVQNMAGISEGSYVQTNQQLAEISPDTGLVAECYVSPRDIGLLKEGMKVHFRVDAFDYNQWGTLTGRITDISKDVIINDNRPFFRVRSVPDRSWLELPNGYKGYLKKGMTLQARFRVTERSLFRLLYDNVDDWLNPSRAGTKEIAQGN